MDPVLEGIVRGIALALLIVAGTAGVLAWWLNRHR